MKSKLVPLVVAAATVLAAAPLTIPTSLSATTSAYAAQAAEAEGTIKGMDPASGTVKIDHGPVQSLGWPAMTMDFQVENKSLLEGVKPGQSVTFTLEQKKGRYVITGIRAR